MAENAPAVRAFLIGEAHRPAAAWTSWQAICRTRDLDNLRFCRCRGILSGFDTRIPEGGRGFHIRQGCPTHGLSAQRLLLHLTIAAGGLPLKHLPDIQYDRLSLMIQYRYSTLRLYFNMIYRIRGRIGGDLQRRAYRHSSPVINPSNRMKLPAKGFQQMGERSHPMALRSIGYRHQTRVK